MTGASEQEVTTQVDGHTVVLVKQNFGSGDIRQVASCRTCQKTAKVYSPDLFPFTAREMHG